MPCKSPVTCWKLPVARYRKVAKTCVLTDKAFVLNVSRSKSGRSKSQISSISALGRRYLAIISLSPSSSGLVRSPKDSFAIHSSPILHEVHQCRHFKCFKSYKNVICDGHVVSARPLPSSQDFRCFAMFRSTK